MRVICNARFIIPSKLEGIGVFSNEIITRLIQRNADVTFTLVFDRAYPKEFEQFPNVECIHVRPPARHPFLFYWWFEISLPKLFSKLKADLFFSPEGFGSLSKNAPKTIITIHDLAFLHFPKHKRRLDQWYFEKFQGRYATSSDHILTVSDFTRNDIVNQLDVPPEKISVVPNASRQFFQPMLPEDQQKIREQITNGTEYFLFVGSIHPRKNVQRLIEAFAICRKQHPNIKLVIAGGLGWKNKTIHKAISTMDNPEDIQFTGYLPSHQLAQIMASAKALVFPSIFEGFGIPVLEAMQCAIPVITSENSAMSEVAGPNNARFINPFDTQSIADAMIDVCQSNPRNRLHVKQGVLRAKEFSWDKSAAIVEKVLFGT